MTQQSGTKLRRTAQGRDPRFPSSPPSGGDRIHRSRREPIPAKVLVTEYSPGAGIGWHKDRPEFEEVIGVSLLSPCLFRLRQKRGNGWERASIELQPRSAYLLSGSARTGWQHSIPPIDKLRYSDLQKLSPLNAQNRGFSATYRVSV